MITHPQISAGQQENGELVISFSGRLDTRGSAHLWNQAKLMLSRSPEGHLVLDLGEVAYLDTSGAALLLHMKELWKERGAVSFQGLKENHRKIMALCDTPEDLNKKFDPPDSTFSFVEKSGRALKNQMEEAVEFIAFTGEITAALAGALIKPGTIRWKDALMAGERAGVNALPIVTLIAFIVGLVMAFQAAIPMKMFGAEIYVANLIGIAMVRELGPLMTSIILAGRSGSSFAAEIGTMKINEEIDALTTMGLDPVKFVMVPRILAAVFITPLLTIFANFVGILGGSIVLISMGYPFITYYHQVVSFVTWGDLMGGLVKCFVFGILIAATGCIRGFQTRSGPSAVGISTTRAVVSGIILIAIFDGIFSVLYYCIGV